MELERISYEILVVEDSKTFNKILSKSLQQNGHRVDGVYTLKEALDAMEKKVYDFIILDLILPDGEGDQIIDDLPKKMRHKVIVLSGDNDIQRRDYLFESGVLDYFSKNNSIALILQDINQLLQELHLNEGVKILTVDDSDFMRRMIKNVLAPKKYTIYEASGVKEGMEILQKEQINLLLLDYEMPDINGAQMLEMIKADRKFLSLPVIVISSKQDKEIIARVLKHGANDFIYKPFSVEELLLKCDLQIKEYLNFQKLQIKELALQDAIKKLEYEKNAKSDFLANMSHEIRTPLNAILGFVALLKEETQEGKHQEYLDIVDSSSNHLLGVINDILDLSKIEKNAISLENEAFDIATMLQHLYKLFDVLAKDKGVVFVLECENLPQGVLGDELRLKQVISNLLSNAIKFTSKGKKVTLKVQYDAGNLKVFVEDEGIGIASENVKNIFEAFSQADSSTTRKYGGTGLGLSISAKLVSLMQGQLQVKSELSVGSCFYFELPLEEVDLKEQLHPKTTKAVLNQDAKILLVEDNRANQMFMQVLFKKMKIAFEVANNGVEAVQMFKSNSYDLILMDENMPNMNGIEATKKILELEEVWKKPHTPIVALTANALKGDRDRFMSVGMDEYLTKPVDRQKLQEVLQRFLAKE